MLREIQVNKTKRKVYAMNENYEVIATFPCSTAFYSGYNEYGQPYCNAEDGVYNDGNVYAEAGGEYNNEEHCTWYGWGYINIDARGHALHGGGANLGSDYNLPYQPLLATLGCFRMHNADVYWLALMFIDAERHGQKPVITVVS